MGQSSRSLPLRAALIYFFGAVAWVLLSDHLLVAIVGSAGPAARIQTVKGGAFVVVTSLLLYGALSSGERRRSQLEAARRAEEARARLLAEYAQDIIFHYRLVEPRGFVYVSPAATPVTGYTPEEHYADPDLGRKLVLEEDLWLLDAAAAAPERPLVLRWRRKDGRVIWTEQRNRPLYGPDGALVGVEGIARDVTAHKDGEAQLARALAAEQQARQGAERAAAQTARLQAVSATLAAALTPEQVVQTMLEHGPVMTGAPAVVVYLVDPAATRLVVAGYSGGPSADARAARPMPLDALLPPATAVRTHEAVWIRSAGDAARRSRAVAEALELFGAQAQACLPLITAGRAIGALSFSFRDRHDFAAEERAFLLSLAQQCAQVIERTRLYSEVREARGQLRQLSQRLLAAQEHERRRIARELHAEVGQVLSALKINLRLLRAQAGQGASAPRLDESTAMLDGLVQQVQALALELRPPALDDLGLMAALESYGERLARRSGLEVRVVGGLDAAVVPPEVATACFRVAQEALTNVVRHAQARRVTVSLGLQDTLLALSVHDDGVGFDVPGQRARGLGGASLGLISMVERAELAGGWADISSSPGAGTEVWACFPMAADPAPGGA